jgi:putative transcriptional regulator
MVRVHLSRLMGEKRVKIADIERDTGLSRTTLSRLYHEKAGRLDFDTLEILCRYLDVQVGDLLEISDES